VRLSFLKEERKAGMTSGENTFGTVMETIFCIEKTDQSLRFTR
jgi:hypothetical protein